MEFADPQDRANGVPAPWPQGRVMGCLVSDALVEDTRKKREEVRGCEGANGLY